MNTPLQLQPVEIKAFVPARDFELSKRFYADVGFTLASSDDEVAYFHLGHCSFLLQNFSVPAATENFMMHLLVENANDWHRHLTAQGIAERYGVRLGAPQDQPWGMRDFELLDPSGVLWRIAQNLPREGACAAT